MHKLTVIVLNIFAIFISKLQSTDSNSILLLFAVIKKKTRGMIVNETNSNDTDN